MLTRGVANLPSRFTAIPPKGEFSLQEVLHLQMEEYYVPPLAIAHGYFCVHPEVHVSIERRIVVPDLEPPR